MGFEYYQPVNVGRGTVVPTSDNTVNDIKPTPEKQPVVTPNTQEPTSKPDAENKPTPELINAIENQSDILSEQKIAEEITETKNKLIEKLGIKNAPIEKQEEILKTIDQRIGVALTRAVVEKSSPEVAAEIEQAIKNDGDIEDIIAKAVHDDKTLSESVDKALKEIWEKIITESEAVKSAS